MMIERGPDQEPGRFFDVLRAMLFYIDEFPERLHHPKESDHLFPKLARAAPELLPVIHQLEADHMNGEANVRELQHLLLGWELIGETRRRAFVDSAQDYVRFYLEHMRIEETAVAAGRGPAVDGAGLERTGRRVRGLARPAGRRRARSRLRRPVHPHRHEAPAPIGVGSA